LTIFNEVEKGLKIDRFLTKTENSVKMGKNGKSGKRGKKWEKRRFDKVLLNKETG
jgi:hypothetical protein